ncbi:MAG: ribosome maturation factor RimP [bacterium]
MSKQKIEETVALMAEPVISELGLEFVDVEFKKEGSDWFLRIFIDKETGVELDDCEKVSRIIDKKLDEIDPIAEAYHLEISSPGLDRPLKKDADFSNFAGRQVKITTYTNVEGKKKFLGELLGLQDQTVKIIDKQGNTIAIPRDKIAKARLAVEL